MNLTLIAMDTAPKDGTHIIIKGSGPDDDMLSFYEAWWWKPTELHQWESGARPHWTTISHNFTREVRNAEGWIPLPK